MARRPSGPKTTAFTWDGPPPSVSLDYMGRVYGQRVRARVLAIADEWAPKIEVWMKLNAPWTDRTGEARRRLRAETIGVVTQIVIMIDHGVPYGRALELAHAGRYAIIGPAMDHFAPLIWRDLKRALHV